MTDTPETKPSSARISLPGRLLKKAADTVVPRLGRFPRAQGAIKNKVYGMIIDDRASLHEFWSQPAPDGNLPQRYRAHVGRSEALAELIGEIPKDARILEVGCNVGRNLAHLYDTGWTYVEGVEINPHAVDLLRETYPQLADCPIHLGPAETQLPHFESVAFDLVFTMAVIEHIHPDSTLVFDEMSRLSGRWIVSIEPEMRASHRQYPHDVREIFTTRGFRVQRKVAMSEFAVTQSDPIIHAYTGWIFERTGTPHA